MKNLMLAMAGLVVALPVLADETTVVGCDTNGAMYKAFMGMTNEMFIPRNGAAAVKFYSPEFYSHNQDRGGGTKALVKAENMKSMYVESLKTYGERKYENELLICQGDYLIARVVMTSKMTGPMGAQAATGKTARISALLNVLIRRYQLYFI